MGAPAARPQSPVVEDSLAVGLNVLFVEDDDADAYLIDHALADNPAVRTVTRARDGFEALGLVDRGELAPDLAFIDLHMPLMNGFDLLFALASRPGRTFPMVVLTSSSAPNDAIRSRLRSAVRVVTKPDTVADLYAVLKTTIEAVCGSGAAKPGKSPAYLLIAEPAPSLRRASASARVPLPEDSAAASPGG